MADNHDFVVDNNVVIEHDEAATTNESLVKYHEMTKDIIKEEE